MSAPEVEHYGLPHELPLHMRSTQDRIRAALGRLDQTAWRFEIKDDTLVCTRRWANGATDQLVVVGASTVVGARRQTVGDTPHVVVWDCLTTIEDIVETVNDLDAPWPPQTTI